MTAPAVTSDLLAAVRGRTPARILAGRRGSAYRTATALELREDHAFAKDAVETELDVDLMAHLGLPVVQTRAGSKAEYLLRPDLGRQLASGVELPGPRGTYLQIVVGDGLSAAAVHRQVPELLPLLLEQAAGRGWSVGRPFAVRYCRVGVLNEVGARLDPAVAALLIGERPGLATAESLSAYLAYRPRPGHTDVHRNLISNIHARGVPPAQAALRVVALAAEMLRLGAGGVAVKEQLGAVPLVGEPHGG